MRRMTAALFVALLSAAPALAQSQTPPPPPPPPPPPSTVVVTPQRTAPTPSPRVGVAVPSVTVETQRGQATTVVSAERVPVVNADRNVITAFARAMPASWQNIKLDVVISDSLVSDPQGRKSVSMLILDGLSGQVRSSGTNEGLINIDARPTIRPDGRVWVQLTIEYRPELSAQQAQQTGSARLMTMFSESLALLVADGKPVMASQSADPRGDRKVSIEVTATVIK